MHDILGIWTAHHLFDLLVDLLSVHDFLFLIAVSRLFPPASRKLDAEGMVKMLPAKP